METFSQVAASFAVIMGVLALWGWLSPIEQTGEPEVAQLAPPPVTVQILHTRIEQLEAELDTRTAQLSEARFDLLQRDAVIEQLTVPPAPMAIRALPPPKSQQANARGRVAVMRCGRCRLESLWPMEQEHFACPACCQRTSLERWEDAP